MNSKTKIIRITTVPISLKYLIKGQMRFMSRNGFDVTTISADGKEIEDIIKNENCKHIVFPLTRKITPLQDLKATYKLYKFLKNEKPEIVHSHTPKAGIVGMLAAKLARVPIRLHTVAGLPLLEAKGLKRLVLNNVEKLTYACATKVYPNSKGLYDIILEQNFSKASKLSIIANGSSNGINTIHFNPKSIPEKDKLQLKQSLQIKDTDFTFVFVGRLVSDKGINELVLAFKNLQNKIANIKLILVGPLESNLDPLQEQTLFEIESNSKIISVGFQEDVRPYFAISKALVFPSYREGFPNVVMQAGAMGLPCIVSNINGCNEIIEDQKNGLIIPVKNVEAIQDAMFRLIVEKTLYNNLQQNARELITSRYEQKVVWHALLKEYNKLIKEQGLNRN